MSNETVVELVKAMTARLSALADEFSDQVSLVTASAAAEPGEPPSEDALRDLARALLMQRRARRRYLPAELFHEPAWDMLLALFVARHADQPMNIKALVGTSDAPVTTSQRWVEHLYKLRLINRVIDPTDRRRVEISLNDAGQDAITKYLLHIAQF